MREVWIDVAGRSNRPGGTPRSAAGRHTKHREARRDPPKIIQRGVLSDALEEAADLEPPLLDVEPEDRRLLRVGQLDGADRLAAPSQPELAPARGAHVAYPLRLPTRGHEILRA